MARDRSDFVSSHTVIVYSFGERDFRRTVDPNSLRLFGGPSLRDFLLAQRWWNGRHRNCAKDTFFHWVALILKLELDTLYLIQVMCLGTDLNLEITSQLETVRRYSILLLLKTSVLTFKPQPAHKLKFTATMTYVSPYKHKNILLPQCPTSHSINIKNQFF